MRVRGRRGRHKHRQKYQFKHKKEKKKEERKETEDKKNTGSTEGHVIREREPQIHWYRELW